MVNFGGKWLHLRVMPHRAGHHVVGVFMRNWDEQEETGTCMAARDFERVQALCRQLGVPAHRVDFVQEYWQDVFSSLLQGYQRGATPNPDVLCNHHIKFDAFVRMAQDRFGADAIATGHYADVRFEHGERGQHRVRLAQPRDRFKDQTYFLAGLPEAVLHQTLFPLAGLTKPEVKELARRHGFPEVASQKESMGVCFIGKRAFPAFLRQYLQPRPGDIVSAVSRRTLGQHEGSFFYTLGQCTRIAGLLQKHYVIGKDRPANIVYAAPEPLARGFLAATEALLQFRWTNAEEAISTNYYTAWRLLARCRHQGDLTPCCLESMPATRCPTVADVSCAPASPAVVGFHPDHAPVTLWEASQTFHHAHDTVLARFAEPLHAPMPGQYVVIYSDSGLCLGSGQILAANHGCGVPTPLQEPADGVSVLQQRGTAVG